jgi:NAD-dependent dihydropyrimidine dehydrogenase PreA subunit
VDAIDGEPREIHEIDPEICIRCGICAQVCPVNAISVE